LSHHFFEKYSGIDSRLHRLDPRSKILAFIPLLALCANTPGHLHIAFTGYIVLLLALAYISNIPVLFLASRMIVIAPLILMAGVFLPFSENGLPGIELFIALLLKSGTAVFCAILLISTTPFSEILGALERLGIPRLFISITSIAYRYVFLIAEEAARMKSAATARGGFIGKRIARLKGIGHAVANLLIRSFERAERIFLAMLARGYSGATPAGTAKQEMRASDYLFPLFVIVYGSLLRIYG